MPLNIRNLAAIRIFSPDGAPKIGQYIYQALTSSQNATNLLEQQTNSNIQAQRPAAPPDVNALKVTAQNGHFQVAITDNNQNLYSGIQYHVEHADNPSFTNSHTIDLGGSRNHNVYLGNVTRYWKAYSSYPSSPVSGPSYHGGSLQPQPVVGGGENAGPAFAPSQGSGTGLPGETNSGPGPVAYRTLNGKLPIRRSK